MQFSGQCFSVEFAALAAKDRADNSEVLKFQREGIRNAKEQVQLGVLIKPSPRARRK
jgi:hypothetical protein